jgi:hypothetical protein
MKQTIMAMLKNNALAAGRFESRLEVAAQQRDERAARAIAQQRQADDHVGEMVPLHDRQHAHQQYLVADSRRRDKQRG